MKREVQYPKVEPCGSLHDDGTKTTHPAFGGIVAHRVSGYRSLYGSDFRHQHFMRVSIRRSEHIRGLSHDWYHGSMQSLIEVDMTEAQWAEFISAPNIGTGVPCTIDNFNGELMPLLPDPGDKREVFANEARKRLDDGMKELADLKRMLATTPGISKTALRAITSKIETAERQLGPNIDYVAKQFGEHVELTVSKAKQDIHGHMLRQLTRAGADATNMPLAMDVDEGRPEIIEPAAQIEPPKAGKIKIVKKGKPDGV